MELFILAWLAMMALGMVIANAKHRSLLEGALLGGLLGCLGVFIVAVLPNKLPPAPRGMRAMKCSRCNAVQNVDKHASVITCWQCGHTAGQPKITPPGSPR